MILNYILVTRRFSRSSLNNDQAFDDKLLRKSPARRRSLTNDPQTPESTKKIRTRRQSHEEVSTPKRQLRKKSVDNTTKTPTEKSEGRRSGRAISVPPSLEIATETQNIFMKKSKSTEASKVSTTLVLPLPNIEEEDSVSSSTLVQNIIEDFSSGRRVTRNQMDLLQKTISEITEKSLIENKTEENSPNKVVTKRRTRNSSLNLSDAGDLQTQKNLKFDVRLSSRASSVPPVSSIAEDAVLETPSPKVKGRIKEHLGKKDDGACGNNHDSNLDKDRDYQTPQTPPRRLRSRSQSCDISDYSVRLKSKSSFLSSIAEEQTVPATLETAQSISNDNTSTRRIARQHKNKSFNRMTSDQEVLKEETNDDELSTTVGAPRLSRRLRSNSQTSENLPFLDQTLKRKTRASSVPLSCQVEANKNQIKPGLMVVLERIPFESEISSSIASPKKPAKRSLRGKSIHNAETLLDEQTNTVGIQRSHSSAQSASSRISGDLSKCWFLLRENFL